MLQRKAGYIDARPLTAELVELSCNARPDHTSGSKCDLVAPSRHDRSCSRSRLELKPQEALDLLDRTAEGDRHSEARSLGRARERRKGYAASSRAISVSKSKRNCAPSSNSKQPAIRGTMVR